MVINTNINPSITPSITPSVTPAITSTLTTNNKLPKLKAITTTNQNTTNTKSTTKNINCNGHNRDRLTYHNNTQNNSDDANSKSIENNKLSKYIN